MASRQRFDDFSSYALGTVTLPTANGVWQADSTRIAPVIVSSAADGGPGPHSGTKMMRMNYNTLQSGTDAEWESLQTTTGFSYTNELFYRMYVRFDANHGITVDGTDAKFLRWYETSPTYNDIFLGYQGTTGNPKWVLRPLVNNAYIDSAQYLNVPTSFTAWVKVEFYFNFSTNTFTLWYDGVQKYTKSGLNFNHNTAEWKSFYPQSNWGAVGNEGYRNGSSNYMYLDDFEIFSDVGSGATGLMSDATIQVSGGGSDTTPPTAPSSLSATAISASRIDLSWTASTDAVGVTNYLVERALGAGSFAQIGTSATTTYSDPGLAESTTYRYQVRATDAAVNLSAYSNIVTQATLSMPPAAPTNLRFA